MSMLPLNFRCRRRDSEVCVFGPCVDRPENGVWYVGYADGECRWYATGAEGPNGGHHDVEDLQDIILPS